jgi:hypothetical protein
MFQWKTTNSISAVIGGVLIVLALAAAQAQTIILRGNQPEAVQQPDRPNDVLIEYVTPKNPEFQELYGRLRDRRALEKIQPPGDATVLQFLWITLHEVGHATFDMFQVPIFGREEDAADNSATYIMLQFGQGQARRLIGGAAWAWRAYLGDYKRNPVVQTRLAAFSSDHGQPQERFYNLLCLAFGANKVEFADAENFLPPTRTPSCSYEYQTLVRAFRKEIIPHIDQEMAKRVLGTNWLPDSDTKPVPQQ